MKSIRLSLMVYFLALLAAALLAASLLVYGNAEQYRNAEQKAIEQLIEEQYGERCEKEKARLDADLLAQARSLARLVQVQFQLYHGHVIQSLLLLGALSNNLSPNGHVLALSWLPEGLPWSWPESNPLYDAVHRRLQPNLKPGIKLKLDQLGLADIQVSDYFQIDSPPSESLRSPSMADQFFPLDLSVFDPSELVQESYDDTKLGDTPVRRVVFKASSVARQVFPPSPPPVSPSPSDAPPAPRNVRRGPNRGPGRGPTTIYVHCAANTDKRDAALADFRQQRDDELAKVADETRNSLHDLRNWLWGISLTVFAATAFGTYGLVRLGLLPLRRLSYAVSQVSAKDFRLPLGERPVPLELRPIVKRLTTTLDLLKHAFAREKQAAADISHELRTPLAALLTTTELALRKPRSPEHYRELLGDVHSSAQQMNQIVERLL
ncbi:MAG TPA: histidine kinase dimerization/phospho-acceptor domain-containing protein, partial [Gemmataceae bacterium]|nr:histidine kinase dimerization/phospho-acceptor domain-containing protein [Gemmataceae bacterium]